MNKEKLPNYYDVSDDEVKKNDKLPSDSKIIINQSTKEDNKIEKSQKDKSKREQNNFHSHSKKRKKYHNKRYHNRSRSKDRSRERHQSNSRGYKSVSKSDSINDKRKTHKHRKYSSSSYSSFSSFNSSSSNEKKENEKSKAIESNQQINNTAFENEFETNNQSSIPKWSSPINQNNIKTLKISNKGKKIEVIMSNQLKPITKENPNFFASGLLAKQTNTHK